MYIWPKFKYLYRLQLFSQFGIQFAKLHGYLASPLPDYNDIWQIDCRITYFTDEAKANRNKTGSQKTTHSAILSTNPIELFLNLLTGNRCNRVIFRFSSLP